MNKITNEQLDSLIKSAVNSSGPLPPDERFSQIISALRELRELRDAMLQGADGALTDKDTREAFDKRKQEVRQEMGMGARVTKNRFRI